MATLVFSAIGTLVGGPVGGAIGSLVGRQVDAALLGGQHREGPRLKELSVTTSSYGTPIPRHFGRMRAPGSIIWATDLVEHSETEGGGKGRPSVTTYSYTASFAVAISSRPIRGIGRIWADGNLLRGAQGDLKVPGAIRIYTGHGDQPADPLIALIEGQDACPAYRGLAYVVFEDLELGDFFNRIPSLTFEVLADDVVSLQQIIGEVIPDTDANLALEGIDGFSCEGQLADTLSQLDPIFGLDADASGELLVIARERLQDSPIALPEAAISVEDEDFGAAVGFARKRFPVRESPPEVLRYYDIDRDFQAGLQRLAGRSRLGQPATVELPAALSAGNARKLVERIARRADWSRDRLAWRMSELNPQVAPGSIVQIPGHAGRWRVREWEWRESGIELTLERIVPRGADTGPGIRTEPGRANLPDDLPAASTRLLAFELPWSGIGSRDTPATFAALSSESPHWAGAALYLDRGDGGLEPLGPSGRTRSIIGRSVNTLAPASPM
ncbi:MAG: phage tail protein, partial [Novosphingobium sp.]|nr:phage tail protein [Novosphingobium sp.]